MSLQAIVVGDEFHGLPAEIMATIDGISWQYKAFDGDNNDDELLHRSTMVSASCGLVYCNGCLSYIDGDVYRDVHGDVDHNSCRA